MTSDHDPGDTRSHGWGRFRARTLIAAVLVGASLVSMAMSAAINYRSAAELLRDRAEQQVVELGASRAERIESGTDALAQSVISLAEDKALGEAIRDFSVAYRNLDDRLTPAQDQELVDAYDRGLGSIAPPGFDVPDLDAVLPSADRARYLQFHYGVANPFPPEERNGLDDAGDGSEYTQVHVRHHPWLRNVVLADGRLEDVLLIDATGAVVYTVNKRADFGVDLPSGPLRESRLAEAILGPISRLPRGQAQIIDFDAYLPAANAPTAFLAAPVREDGRYLGTLAVPIVGSALSSITTAGGDWEAIGLGETGEVYVVGEDLLMRSDSRLATEDPEQYAAAVVDAGYDESIAAAAAAFGTTVLIQPVDTEAVRAGLVGDPFGDVSRNFLDQETLTVSRPLTIPGVNWVAVAEISTDEVFQPLQDYQRRALIVGALLVPVVILLGFGLARRLMRPIGPVVEAVRQVSAGDLTVEMADRSRDEFGELARRFNEMVATLRAKDDELRTANDEATELLLSAFPRRLVAQVKAGELDIAESVRNGSIVAIGVDGIVEDSGADRDAQRHVGVRLHTRLARLADRHGVDPVHSSASELLFGAGLESDELEAGRAAGFALAARRTVADLAGSEGAALTFRCGVAAGEFVVGLVGTDRLTFDAWGGPPRLAIGLMTVAGPGEILCDAVTVEALDDRYRTDRISGLVDMGGDVLDGWALNKRSGPPASGDKAAPEPLDGRL